LRIIRFLWVFWQRRKASVSGLAAVIHETQEVEHLRPRPALAPTVSFSKPSELDQPRLVLLEMKTEIGQSPPDVPLISVNRPRILIPPCIHDLKAD
jgi:hypothetical protein